MANVELSITVLALLLAVYFIPSLGIKVASRLGKNYKPAKTNLVGSTSTTLAPPYPASEAKVQKESPFSSAWVSDPALYQLERRAVFSKTWHNITHISLFPSSGTYITPLPLGGYPIFLILGRDKPDPILRAFHNVCRHRAYEVTRKECGKSLVLGCRYHGWSYDTKGKLVKAPEFEGIQGWEGEGGLKEKNGLWEIGCVVDSTGSVWVCLDAEATHLLMATKSLETEQMHARDWAIRESHRLEEWKVIGKFNWKFAAGAFDELSINDPSPSLWTRIKSLAGTLTQETARGFPFTTLHYARSSGLWFAIRIFPQSATRTTIQCELYRTLNSRSGAYQVVSEKLKNDIRTIIERLEATQAQVTSIYEPLDLAEQTSFHNKVHDLLRRHTKLEKIEGREIHPAARATAFTEAGKADDELCRELERGSLKAKQNGNTNGHIKSPLDW